MEGEGEEEGEGVYKVDTSATEIFVVVIFE